MWSWRKEAAKWQPAEDIGTECEAFLQGTYAEYLDSLGHSVPNWAWLNTLAHGTEEQITSLVNGTCPSYESAAGGTDWYQAIAFLAIETLGQARATGRPLVQLQGSSLVALELDLAREGHNRWLAPKEVVRRTLTALHEHPSDRR